MNVRLTARTLLLGTLLLLPSPAFTAPATENSAFSKEIIALTNKDRAVFGVAELHADALLSAAAQKKAEDMAAHGYFSHYSPEGVSPWYWFTAVGYRYTRAGENLAVHIDDPRELEAAWMASPSHRDNILKEGYTHIGIGVSRGTYKGKPATFVVQLFATPASPFSRLKKFTPLAIRTP
jgi:uncharacterized protein YkwD